VAPLNLPDDLKRQISASVAQYWRTRGRQSEDQRHSARADQGLRSAVTGGAQMDGFVDLLAAIATANGVPAASVFRKKALEIPGFFRPTKEWDLLIVHKGRLVAAIEAKSQVGPSFGNNFNNRTEEAMGSALDVWTAYREGAFAAAPQPFLGYFFMLEDCKASQSPVRVKEPHFRVLPEFKGASYAKRYELFCRKLVRERHYQAAAFLTSRSDSGIEGEYTEPAADLNVSSFLVALAGHVGANVN